MLKFAERLKSLRKEKNILQADMARLLECSENHYQRFEYGQSNPPYDKLIKLADYFDVSTDYLLGRDEVRSHKLK